MISVLNRSRSESDESNNRLAQPITVTAPDLVPTALTAPPAASAQQAVSVSWTVKNQGTGPALGQWTDQIYLSPTPTCCAGATLVATVNVAPGTPVGGSYTSSATVNIPAVAAGTYSLIVIADAFGARSEGDESNNRLARPVTVTTPDLTPVALFGPLITGPGQSVSVSWTVKNQGTGPAVRGWTDTIYVSPNPTCCAGATSLASVSSGPGLSAGATYSQSHTITVPHVTAGTYYWLIKTDVADSLYEASETNNERSRKTYVTR